MYPGLEAAIKSCFDFATVLGAMESFSNPIGQLCTDGIRKQLLLEASWIYQIQYVDNVQNAWQFIFVIPLPMHNVN